MIRASSCVTSAHRTSIRSMWIFPSWPRIHVGRIFLSDAFDIGLDNPRRNRNAWTELFMTPTENPASTSPTGDRHTAGWIGLAARRSLLALRLIADSERIVGKPYL